MITMNLSSRDIALLDAYEVIFTFITFETDGNKWVIHALESDMEFGTYKEFISFIESEVKEALLNYLLNCELGELTRVLPEYV